VEGQADAMADAAAHLVGQLAALGREPGRSLDAIAVFRSLSRSAESMAAVAAELHHQSWPGPGDDTGSDDLVTWDGALEGLRRAASTFRAAADGWI
jgi:hypothetical protein